jgi:hypothetical protein
MTDHPSPASLSSCAAALLLLSVSIAVIERNVRRTTIASGKSGALVTEVCDQAGVPANLRRTPSLQCAFVLTFNLLDGALQHF